MECAIKLQHVNKHLGKRLILKDVSFETYAGEVFGFLGPNGAGKTTTIKLITGLLKMEDGTVNICGYDVEKEFEDAMRNVGAIVENPEMYSYMTGMQNLMQYARMRGNIPKERINEVVALVGLSNRIHEKIKKYSLGMRQRLGVAQALLHNPKLLILDEPTNGLDPAGIKQLRDLLKSLAHEHGISVLVSSHLMSEMELMCDRVGIIINGEIQTVKTLKELVEMAAGATSEFDYQVSDSGLAESCIADILKEIYPEKETKLTDSGTDLQAESFDISPSTAPSVPVAPASLPYRIEKTSDTTLSVFVPKDSGKETIAQCNAALIQNGITLYAVSLKETTHLEDAFIMITRNGGAQIA